MPAHPTVVARDIPVLLGPRAARVGHDTGCWVHGVEASKPRRHLLHAIVGLAAQDWVMHQAVCIWSLRQKKRKLVSIALVCLVEVAAIADGGQGEEGRDSVHGPGHGVGVIVTVELKGAVGPAAAPSPTRTAGPGAHLLGWKHCPVSVRVPHSADERRALALRGAVGQSRAGARGRARGMCGNCRRSRGGGLTQASSGWLGGWGRGAQHTAARAG